MATSLFNAPETDPVAEARKRRAKFILAGALIGLIIIGGLFWSLRFWPEQRVVDRLFTQIEKKNYAAAFGTWNADPDWEKHAEKYSTYTYGQFQLDWGPTGDWGEITNHEIVKVAKPASKAGVVSGVIVAARLNGRSELACLWVEKSSKAVSFAPREWCNFKQLNIFR